MNKPIHVRLVMGRIHGLITVLTLTVLVGGAFDASAQTTNIDSTAYVAHIEPPDKAVFFEKPFFVVLVIEEKMPAELPNQDAFVMASPTNTPYTHFAHSGQSFEQNRVWRDVVSLKPVKSGPQQLGPFRIRFRGHELTTGAITIDVLSTNVLEAITVTLSADKAVVREGEELMLILNANKFYSGLEPEIMLPTGLVATGYVMISSGADFVNGALVPKETRRFKIKAFKAGVYTLRQSAVRIGGKYYDVDPLKITVEP